MKLGKLLAFAVVFVLLGSVAFAQETAKCKPQNVLVDVTQFQVIEPPAGTDYPFCGTIPVRGTLTGIYYTCFVSDPSGISGWSLFPLSPDEDVYSAYFAEWIETAKGRLELQSVTVGYSASGLQAGLSKIVPEGSTGAYSGASGYLSLLPEWQTFVPETGRVATVWRLNGYLCLP